MYIVIILDDDDSDSDNNNDNDIDGVRDKSFLEWFCLENQAKKCHVVSGGGGGYLLGVIHKLRNRR